MLAELDLPTLQCALEKVERRRLQAAGAKEEYTQAEIDALSCWMNLQLDAARAKETRADRSERRKAAWAAGDRREFGGEVRKRDKRRGWRNFNGGR